MFFSKSMTFDREDLTAVALASDPISVNTNSENELIEKLQAGDTAAFDNLITDYAPDVFAMLFRLTGSEFEANDLVQETFLSAIKNIGKFRGEASLKTWLYSIAVNHSRNHFRWWKRRKRDLTISLDAPVGKSEITFGETVADCAGSSPEENALRREREKMLVAALNELPVIYREIIILCDIEEFSYDEIAQTLKLNIGTVKSRIARGRDELRRKLKDI